MKEPITIAVKCPTCNKSLMNSDILIDDLPSICVTAKIGSDIGRVCLSQLYGSYNKSFISVNDTEGSIAEFSCPHCHKPFPVQKLCDCEAPLIGFTLQSGGVIKICTRNGCKNHSLEFADANDAFLFFQNQDRTGLI